MVAVSAALGPSDEQQNIVCTCLTTALVKRGSIENSTLALGTPQQGHLETSVPDGKNDGKKVTLVKSITRFQPLLSLFMVLKHRFNQRKLLKFGINIKVLIM